MNGTYFDIRWYILVCSMIGGISVNVTTGLGAAIVETAYGDEEKRTATAHAEEVQSHRSKHETTQPS